MLFKRNRNVKEAVTDFLKYLQNLNEKSSDSDKHQINLLIRKIEAMRIGIYDDRIHNSFFEGLYITCFSEIKDDILMWSHYSDSDSGFCVEYDFGNLFDQTKTDRIDIFPVIYGRAFFLITDLINVIVLSHR